MIILRPYEPKIYPVVPISEWREPSLSMPRNMFGDPEWWVRFSVTAKIGGREVWRGWFESRDDADAFLWAAVTRTLHIQRALCHLPDPIWSPGWYKDEDIVWQYAVTNYFTSGTSTTIPSDWNNSNNTITAIGGGGNGDQSSGPKAPFLPVVGGGGGACSRITNQSYTASATRTRQVGTAGNDTFLKADNNSTNAILAQAGSNNGNGGSSSSGTGTAKYSGGAGGSQSGNVGGGGGGAASATANGNPGSFQAGGSSGDGALAGANGTGLGSGYGSGGGGAGGGDNASGSPAGNYGGGGGGAGSGSGTPSAGGAGAPGLLVMEYTPAAATSFRAGFNMPKGW